MAVYQNIGTEWSNNDPTATELQSSIGWLSGGSYVVAWVDGNGGENNIRAQIFNSDGSLVGGEFIVNAPNDPPAWQVKAFPTIALLDNGNFVIAWDESYRGTNGSGIMAHVFDQNGGSVGAPFLAGTYSNSNIANGTQPHIIAAGSDQFYVLSLGALPYDSYNVFAQKVDSAGNILGVHTNISDIVLAQGQGAFLFDSARISSGNTVVSYLIYDGNSTTQSLSVSARIVDANMQPIGLEIIVDASSPNAMGYSRELIAVAALADGGFVVNWEENSPTSSSVTDFWVQRYDNVGTALGLPILVTSIPNNNNGYSGSDIAVLDDGNFLVTWQGDGSTYVAVSTIGQLFDASGQKVGIPFHISSGSGRYSQVTAIDGGGFAVTYLDNFTNSGNAASRAFSYGIQPATQGDDIILVRQGHIDAVNGLSGNDTINGNMQNNFLYGGLGNDVLYGGKGKDLLDGGADVDTATYFDSTGAVKANLSLTAAQNTGASGIDTLLSIENLIGSRFADTLIGNSDPNRLVGGAGNDKLDGGGGVDRLEGGAGNDIYTVDNVDDLIVEIVGEGTDLVNASVSFDLGSIFFFPGMDTIENLTLTGSANIDGMGNQLANKITGNAGDNVLSGNGGKDNLSGGAGNDTLIGGFGADILTGGLDSDRFEFNFLSASIDKDTVKDFVSGTDTIALSVAAFGGLAGYGLGALDPGELAFGTRATTAAQHLIYNPATGALLYDADGLGGVAAITLALLTGHPPLAESDIILF